MHLQLLLIAEPQFLLSLQYQGLSQEDLCPEGVQVHVCRIWKDGDDQELFLHNLYLKQVFLVVLGKERLLGSIEIGKQAAFSLIDISTVHATTMFDPITHLVYSTNKSDVSDVFVGGIHLVKQRKIVSYDIVKTLMKVKDMTPKIRQSLIKD